VITGTSEKIGTKKPLATWSPAGTLDDYCQQVLGQLGWPGRENQRALRTLGITSCRSGEGVSTLAAHMAAAAAARQEGKVVLVDANLTAPAAMKIFGIQGAPGFVECVNGGENVADALQATTMENLHVLTAGKIQGSPARTFDADGLAEVVSELADLSALTIFDLPPVRQASCVHRLTAALDGILLVVEARAVTWDAAAKVKDILAHAGAHIVGVVLNNRRPS